MRRIVILIAAVAALTVIASPAQAARWTGVVVAKDGARKAVVTASANGTVRTTRSASFRSLKVGQRVGVAATRLRDGTYRSTSVRVAGRQTKTRFRAVVVRSQRASRRLLVSAGGSTFAVTRRSKARTTASRASGEPKPGDQIEVEVSLEGTDPEATSLKTVGHVATVHVEGIVTKLGDGSIEVIVARAGFVTVALPAGFALPAGLKVFDEVSLVATVGADGKLTAVSLEGDDEDVNDDGEHADDDGDHQSGQADENDDHDDDQVNEDEGDGDQTEHVKG